MQALNDYVFIEPVPETTTNSGLILEDDKTDPIRKGKVVSIGLDIKDKSFEVGDTVHFKRSQGWEIEENLVWVKYENCLLVQK